MIIGGGEAGDIGQKYGAICGIYYPIKGFILNGMKVDQYDDYIVPDFIAPASEYEFQFIGSINVASHQAEQTFRQSKTQSFSAVQAAEAFQLLRLHS